jgi:hypothetical protein
VPTTSADRKALECVEEELLKRSTDPGYKAHSVVDVFQAALKVSPWDPEGTVRKEGRGEKVCV